MPSDSGSREPTDVSQQSADRPSTGDGVTPAVAIPDFSNLFPRQVTIHEWRVLNLSNPNTGRGNRVYEVNIRQMECSCPDWQYRRGESPSVCKHMAAAIFAAEQTMRVDEALAFDTLELGREVRDLADDLQRKATGLQADAQAAQSGTSGGTAAGSGEDPQDAADRLEAAYDDVVEDMQVRATDSYVWVQTGQDTPENLPGPGSTSVFQALLQNPEQVEFVPDDYNGDYPNAGSEKPGEWWKNCLKPEDVDGYISEVLEG